MCPRQVLRDLGMLQFWVPKIDEGIADLAILFSTKNIEAKTNERIYDSRSTEICYPQNYVTSTARNYCRIAFTNSIYLVPEKYIREMTYSYLEV